jgi:glycosyltransferase involved in cell wall biosynthesis
MAMAPPAVSVVMPVYQAADFLAEAIESILAQTYPDLELIAVDDGSHDASLAILERLARRDARVRVLARPHRGVIPARNEGLRHARGELVACMDADDVSLPHRLERQVAALASDPGLVCLGGAFEVIDAKDRLLNRWRPPQDHDAIVAMALTGRSPICGSNATFRRDAALAIGGYDPDAPFVEDLDLWLRLAAVGRLANLPEVISRVRFRDDSQSAVEQQRQVASARRIANRARARLGIREEADEPPPYRPLPTRRSRQEFALGWAISAWRIGERRTALRYAARAFASNPLGAPLWSLIARKLARCAMAGLAQGKPAR